MKVITIVGTRPEIIRLSRVIKKLDDHTEHTLVHTGQNYDYELNKVFFEDLQIRKPDYFLESAASTPAQTISNVIATLDGVLADVNPDAFLVLGDTNSSLGVIPAKRRKIPIFHMEAGNRCFDQRVPEEINRKIVDHVADINLPYSTIARDYLIREGFPVDQIVKTGSPMFEVLDFYKEGIEKSQILKQLDLEREKYFVLSTHREENVDSSQKLNIITTTINELVEKYQFPVVFSVHPRTREKISTFGLELHPKVKMMKPLGFLDYIHLQKNAFCTISDSGTITEESSILDFPAINLREAHERPEGMEEGAVILTGIDKETIIDSIKITRGLRNKAKRSTDVVRDYVAPNVSDIVLKTIIGYTGFVNRKIWKK